MPGMAAMAVEKRRNTINNGTDSGGGKCGWRWCTILQLQTKARKLLFFFSAILLLLAIYAKVKC